MKGSKRKANPPKTKTQCGMDPVSESVPVRVVATSVRYFVITGR